MLCFKGTLVSLVLACSFSSSVLAQSQEAAPGSAEVEGAEEIEEIIVKTTRSGRRVQDEPIRVDVLNQEEIEEKVMMRPGNIVMMLAETGGLRVQTTSPALGAANIRVQGLSGRYTQLLTDGLPLYGGQAISLLQIPPTDLGQVEVIKGAASALYGPSALGGVVNLISRRPGADPLAEIVLNATSRNGQDATSFTSMPLGEEWSASLIGGVHRQEVQDIDDDGWSDMPGYERWILRPRLFWASAGGSSVFVTAGAMGEQREGGTLEGRTVPNGTFFPQTQKSHRFDGGLVAEIPVSVGTLHLRGSAMTQNHSHRFGTVLEDDRHDTLFGEASFAARSERTSWLAGLAVQEDAYRSDTFSQFDYTTTAPGVFAQVEHDLSEEVTLAGSARWDDHNVYGGHFSPRLSMLYRPGPWTVRASVGRGFYAPTPFVDEIDDAGLSRLQPLAGLKAETAGTASLEGGYSQGALETNLTFFASRIKNAVRLEDLPAPAQGVRLVNIAGDTNTIGVEFLARYRWEGFAVTGSYVLVHAREPDLAGGRRTVPLTPRHTGGVVAMWEREDAGRLGLEVYYTGKQVLDGNPYRSMGHPYVEIGLLGEIVLGRVRLFLNLENLLNVRQTKYDPIIRPSRATDGRWAVDVWAPTDGFVVNGGIRFRFGES